MRKFLIGLGIFLVVLLTGLALAPFLFKDKIRAAFDQQLAQRVRANVEYDPANVDVTLLSTFPDLALRLSIEDGEALARFLLLGAGEEAGP